MKPKKLDSTSIINFISGADYKPLRFQELMTAMDIPEGMTKHFTDEISGLLSTGWLVKLQHKGYVINDKVDLMIGKINFVRSGAAFVKDYRSDRETFIKRHRSGTALPGDKVLVRINRGKQGQGTERSAEGKVIRVLDRNTTTIVGTLKKLRKAYYVEPLRPGLLHDVIIHKKKNAKIGDRVLVKIAEWDDERIGPEGKIVDVIGPMDEPSHDTLAVIHEYNLQTKFTEEVIQQVERIDSDFSMIKERLDLRDSFVFTIDPESARDFDDAISLEKRSGGGWQLGVHIADVSYFVKEGSALDREAYKRSTSAYFLDMVIPMLPEHLSNGLCSLREDKDRLTFSAMIQMDDNGNVIAVEFRESIIRSKVRLTYGQVQLVLTNPGLHSFPDMALSKQEIETIRATNRLTKKMRLRRFRDGALNMALPEPIFKIAGDGTIAAIGVAEDNESHHLIEECMLLANELVCKELTGRKICHLHRIHEPPDPEKTVDLEERINRAGIVSKSLEIRANLIKFLSDIAELPEAHAWNIAVLKTMKRALYSTKAIGHYGLAKEFYTHFTSPIRRYPDLVIHRILKSALISKQSTYSERKLAEVAEYCSDRERNAESAERDLRELKIIRYFENQLETGNLREYPAVIVDVRNFGMFVDIPEVQAYGLIHVSMLKDDYYDFDPVKNTLKGRHSRVIFGIGTTLTVTIAKVVPEKRLLDFVPVNLG